MYQLTLPVQLRPEADLSSFVIGRNAEAVSAVRDWAARKGEAFLYLFGTAGSGKTHLLQAACRRAVQNDVSAVYLPLGHPDLSPAVLDDLELCDLVALDDLQAVAGKADWEHALFDLYNRLREAERGLLTGANGPVADLPLKLADLRSRLGSGPGYRLRPLGEDDLGRLVREAAEGRGLALADESIDYIMRRYPRDPGNLMALVDEIDRESLRKQRRPTLWLIRQVLRSHQSTDGGD